jgi:hypothetical protein
MPLGLAPWRTTLTAPPLAPLARDARVSRERASMPTSRKPEGVAPYEEEGRGCKLASMPTSRKPLETRYLW